MEKYYYYHIGECFVPSKSEAKLQKINIIDFHVNVETGENDYTYLDVNERVHNTPVDKLGNIYRSEEDFKRGKKICLDCINFDDIARSSGNFGASWEQLDETRYTLCGYIFKGGEVERVNFEPCTITVNEKEVISVTLPDLGGEVYPSREECLAWNDYDVVTEGGVKTVRGWKKRLLLTDEQKAAVKAFEEAGKRMKELGVLLLYSDDCGGAFPVNELEIVHTQSANEVEACIDDFPALCFPKVCIFPNVMFGMNDGSIILHFKDDKPNENADS